MTNEPPSRAHLGGPAQYLLGFGAVFFSTLLAYLIAPWAQLADLVIVHLLGVIAVAARFALVPSLVCAMLSILAFDYFFIPPLLTFSWPDPKSALTFFGMLVVAAVVNGLSRGLRREREAARRSEAHTLALQSFGEGLANLGSLTELEAFALRRLEELFHAQVRIGISHAEAELDLRALALGSSAERELAKQAWSSGQLAYDPSVRPFALWLPLVGSHGRVGVAGLRPFDHARLTDPDGLRLLAACLFQFGGAVERVLLTVAARRAELEAETERARGSLLAAISHDLKTPLASILLVAGTLQANAGTIAAPARKDLLDTLVDEAERLTRLVANVLSITKLEGSSAPLRKQPEDITEVVETALAALSTRLTERRVGVSIERGLPLVEVDAVLLQQVLINLLENALRHAPASDIEVRAAAEDGQVVVTVHDDGPGIPLDEHDKVFEKFFRGSRASRNDGGVGLGLTICRAIVQAHGGKIYVQSEHGPGTNITFSLPARQFVTSEDECAAAAGLAE
ncbi:MAG: ATP-binding protein [Polyangiaceae bacterium]